MRLAKGIMRGGCIGGCLRYVRVMILTLTAKPDNMLSRFVGWKKKWESLYISTIASVPTEESSEPGT
ncbi:hypothetical protein GYMLUDRAFT_470721 [Collybiopsis luxurians FD-317 M1]|uniref:Uncharacterized protein n=1 Tax=Collybiopsis luxurians FD-317 M1 TaxID=944289 RepID=A0A0D0BLC8_9AGAR|nr:hypothetical protein GYMLUDRAFT_470721 [Collybiopsis luxurians FD-317 M1]